MSNFQSGRKFVLDLRPGDVLGSEENCPLHNGDPRVVQVVRTQDLTATTYAIHFADGSISETTNGAQLVSMEIS